MLLQRKIQLLGISLSIVIFICSSLLPPGFHVEFIYSLIILLTIWVPGRRGTFDASVALTILILGGYMLRKIYYIPDLNFFEFLLPILFIWAFTFAIIKYKETQDHLIRSTEHLNAMFQHATEGILISDSKGEIIMANPRAKEQFGYTDIAITGKSIEDLIPRRFVPNHHAFRNKYYADPHNRPMGKGINLFAKRLDKSEFPVEISLSSFKIKNELFVISFIIDITERKKQEDLVNRINEELEERVELRTRELAQTNLTLEEVNRELKEEMEERAKMGEALRDSERLFSTIAHNFPGGIICVLNKEMQTLFLDGKVLIDMGLKRDQLTGIPVEHLPFLPCDEPFMSSLQKVFEWESASLEFEYGSSFYSLSAVPLPDTRGFVKEILLVIQDVTELKNAERETLLSLEKERTLNEMKSKFVSLASHEFRTPLSTILSSVSLVEKYSSPENSEKRARHIDRIKTSVKNLTEILNDFLSVEKLEAGKVEMRPTPFNITGFSEDLCEEMQALTKPGQKVVYHHYGATSEVFIDRQMLRNICINLLNNAIKYSPEETDIEFNTFINGIIRLEIQDHGIGIPEEDQMHLFERFFRAGNATGIQGTGLGLNIVHRYIQILNGKIDFISIVNKGTTFTVTLPQQTT